VSLAVTPLAAPPRVALPILGVLAAALDGRAQVALERCRDPGSKQSRPRDRARPEPLPELVGRLDRPSQPIVFGPEEPELLALPERRRPHPEEPDALAPDLRPG